MQYALYIQALLLLAGTGALPTRTFQEFAASEGPPPRRTDVAGGRLYHQLHVSNLIGL